MSNAVFFISEVNFFQKKTLHKHLVYVTTKKRYSKDTETNISYLLGSLYIIFWLQYGNLIKLELNLMVAGN